MILGEWEVFHLVQNMFLLILWPVKITSHNSLVHLKKRVQSSHLHSPSNYQTAVSKETVEPKISCGDGERGDGEKEQPGANDWQSFRSTLQVFTPFVAKKFNRIMTGRPGCCSSSHQPSVLFWTCSSLLECFTRWWHGVSVRPRQERGCRGVPSPLAPGPGDWGCRLESAAPPTGPGSHPWDWIWWRSSSDTWMKECDKTARMNIFIAYNSLYKSMSPVAWIADLGLTATL